MIICATSSWSIPTDTDTTFSFICSLSISSSAAIIKSRKEITPTKFLYIVDENKHLVGVISLRDLIIAADDDIVSEHMNENVVSVSVGMDQEDVAQMIMDYDFLAVPVIDFQEHLLGIITVDDILDVVDEEASEDY